jgi:hypothetical protein
MAFDHLKATYQVEFVFNDGKNLHVNVEGTHIEQFFKELSTKNIYWNDLKSLGFWTNLDNVRFVSIKALAQPSIQKITNKGENEQRNFNEILSSDPEVSRSYDSFEQKEDGIAAA